MRTIPMFPLSILPMPGEMVPLHIFEPRYKQLLQDAETDDIDFGIFYNHVVNTEKIGSLMKLESVIKRYPSGEADIVVKCHDMFSMETLYRNFKSKMYPGGDITPWELNIDQAGSIRLTELFLEFLKRRNITRTQSSLSIYSMAQELNLDAPERYNFLTSDQSTKVNFLLQRIHFQLQLFQHEEKSKDVFHLN